MSWARPRSLQHGPGGMRKGKREWKRYRKSGWKVKECHRRRRRWEGIRGFGRAMGLSSWRVDRLGSDSSMCISDPCPLSVHTHSSPYSNSGIHKHFPTDWEGQSPNKRAFCRYFVFVVGIVNEKGGLLIERICLYTPSLHHIRLLHTWALILV